MKNPRISPEHRRFHTVHDDVLQGIFKNYFPFLPCYHLTDLKFSISGITENVSSLEFILKLDPKEALCPQVCLSKINSTKNQARASGLRASRLL